MTICLLYHLQLHTRACAASPWLHAQCSSSRRRNICVHQDVNVSANPTLTSSPCAVSICCCCCSVRLTVNHFRLLFCAFLRHSLIQKLFTNYSAQREDANRLPSRWQQQATRRPTYSIARAKWATGWQRSFICRCHYLR